MPEQKFRKIKNNKSLFVFKFFDLLRETFFFFCLSSVCFMDNNYLTIPRVLQVLSWLSVKIKVGPVHKKAVGDSAGRATLTLSFDKIYGVGWLVPFSSTCTFAMSKETQLPISKWVNWRCPGRGSNSRPLGLKPWDSFEQCTVQ